MNSDFKDLLEVLNECGVEYLVVGGHAVMRYTEPRFTKDLDLWVSNSAENADRLFRALARYGAPLGDATPADFTTPDGWFQIGQAPVRVDILLAVPGLHFADAWAHRTVGRIFGVEAAFLSLEHLLLAKEAAGRAQDRADARRLRRAMG